MEQKTGAPHGAQPRDIAQPSPLRPAVPDRAESTPPPHLRPSVIAVPVTPGITREAYESEASDKEGPGGSEAHDYFSFSRHDIDHAIAASPAPGLTNREGQSFQNKVVIGAQEGKDFLRRLSIAVMGAQGESMSDIRAMSPDLSLTGNIISATFNIPHSLRYHKGADWVCASFCLFVACTSILRCNNKSGRYRVLAWWGLMSSFPCRN